LFHFFINSKNYPEAAGSKTLKLASAVSKAFPVAKRVDVKLHLAIPAFSISELSKKYPKISILAQHLDAAQAGSTTGYLVPEIAVLSGASGSLVNHSEHRISEKDVEILVNALRLNRMQSVVCARDAPEVAKFSAFNPDFIAIEPPELIGTGTAISKARPELITESADALSGIQGKNGSTVLVCGAGIVDNTDVRRARELGAEGILVASGVVKAHNWAAKIQSLARGFE
jgi:triosephosphate isomerase (TIM)